MPFKRMSEEEEDNRWLTSTSCSLLFLKEEEEEDEEERWGKRVMGLHSLLPLRFKSWGKQVSIPNCTSRGGKVPMLDNEDFSKSTLRSLGEWFGNIQLNI